MNIFIKVYTGCIFCAQSALRQGPFFDPQRHPPPPPIHMKVECPPPPGALPWLALQSKNRHFTWGSQTMGIFGNVSIVTFEIEGQTLKMTVPHAFIKISAAILVSSCWKKNFIRNNAHNFFILSVAFLKLLIVSVAFSLGHPV